MFYSSSVYPYQYRYSPFLIEIQLYKKKLFFSPCSMSLLRPLAGFKLIGENRNVENRRSDSERFRLITDPVPLESILFMRSWPVVWCEDAPKQVLSDSQSEDQEKLFHLCRTDDRTALTALISSRCDFRRRDGDSWTCLHWAVEYGHRDLVLYLLDKEPLLLSMKTSEGLSAINIAAWRGDKEMVELLLAEGAEVDDRTKWGEAPLHHAATFGHSEVCKTLLKAGADPFTEDKLRRSSYKIAMEHGSGAVKEVFLNYVKNKSS